MNIINKTLARIDKFQRSHRPFAFIYAVIKKYGDDEAGYQAALFTYFAFLSLFPLLLVLTTVAGIVAKDNPELQNTIVDGITNYFPVLGNQLSGHIQGIHKSGVALLIGLALTLYGARGVADAFRHGVNHIWQVPRNSRDTFPKAALKSLGLVLIGGAGLVGASLSASLAASAGHGPAFRALSIGANLLVLFALFSVLLNLSLPKHVTFKETRAGAAVAAIGLVLLQGLGGYVLTRELKSLDALYSYFAIALGLLFWIYLQAQVLFYAIEVASVGSERLWPRSLTGKNLTSADKRAFARSAAAKRMVPEQKISSEFED